MSQFLSRAVTVYTSSLMRPHESDAERRNHTKSSLVITSLMLGVLT